MALSETIFQLAEAISAISVPVGGGLAAYAKWRRSAQQARTTRENAARIAAEKAAKDARDAEAELRNRLLAEKDDRISKLENNVMQQGLNIAQLHERLEKALTDQRDRNE